MMKMSRVLTMLVPAFLLAAEPDRSLDGVAAIVGDSVILKSDVNAIVQMKIAQTGGSADLLMQNMIYNESLEELVDGLVLVVKSAKDTNIVVTQNEVSEQVSSRINSIMKQNKITEEQLIKALEQEQGISYSEFRDRMMQQIQQELVRQRVQQFFVAGSEMSRAEVRQFYTDFKDSLPAIGESVRLQKLELALKPDSTIRQNAFSTINAIRQRAIETGDDFLGLADKYKTATVVPVGGDLGFVSKGTLAMIRLEQMIFTLQPGEVSQPIETRLGFHIVKVLERRDSRVHALHILIPVQPSAASVTEKTALLDSIRTATPSHSDFAKAIAAHSTDDVSRAYNGELEWQTVASLDKALSGSFTALTEGAYSSVQSIDNTLYLYRVHQYDENRAMNLDNDWTQIEQYARQILMQKRLGDLVKSWRKDVFIQKYQ